MREVMEGDRQGKTEQHGEDCGKWEERGVHRGLEGGVGQVQVEVCA